ncbi:Hypothetical protein (Fragment) [Durusdinium trenchii]|uniref:FCP1 homology domain-containing protein n=1 Tax=Durusdinium trenchii TaxID=1381693 RepID=A0ABP0HGB2_9DINO
MAIAPRVIFLDVDGVLHPADAPGGNALEDEDLFRRPCLERLAWVANHGHAAIVLSSSWRLDKDSLAEVERHLASVGLSVLDSTATDASMGPSARAQEIVDWLRAHEATEACVVLDDLDLSPSLGKSCVIVNGQEALTDADAESAVEVLTTDAGDVSELLKAFVQVGEEMAWRHRWEMLERKAAKKKKKKKEKKES